MLKPKKFLITFYLEDFPQKDRICHQFQTEKKLFEANKRFDHEKFQNKPWFLKEIINDNQMVFERNSDIISIVYQTIQNEIYAILPNSASSSFEKRRLDTILSINPLYSTNQANNNNNFTFVKKIKKRKK